MLLNSPHISTEAKGWIQAMEILREQKQIQYGVKEIGFRAGQDTQRKLHKK